MGFLHKLWDETLAGPAPDSGLGKLRKYNSLSNSRSSSVQLQVPGDVDQGPVSKAVVVGRNHSARMPNLTVSVDSCSMTSSPATPSTPTTPRSPTILDGNIKKLMRGKSISAVSPQGGSRTTSVDYDWLVLKNALDR